MSETPEERRERWRLFEAQFGPIPQPPTIEQQELAEELAAWNRWTGLFWIPWGDGTGWS